MSKFSGLFDDTDSNKPNNDTDWNQVAASKKYSLLLVDDEVNVTKALKRAFRRENYNIFVAHNGKEALELLQEQPVEVVISDYMMPGMTGAELLREIKKRYPETIRIMLTGHADTQAVMSAIKDGAVYKFILKPWNDDDLRVNVALGIEKYELLKQNRKLNEENQKTKEKLGKLVVNNRSQLVIMLNKRGHLTDQQVQKLYKDQQMKKQPFVRLLAETSWVTEKTISKILTKDFMFEQVLLGEFNVKPEVISLLPKNVCHKQWVVPLKLERNKLTIAMADPMDEGLIEDLRFTTGLNVYPVYAPVKEIKTKLVELFGEEQDSIRELETVLDESDQLDTIEIILEDEDDVTLDELLSGSDEPPAIRIVNAVIMEAIRLKCSDIHIQPKAKYISVRFRIDGVLQEKIQIPLNMQLPLVSRIKVMSELDITERRRPQDGRITIKTPMRIVDLRISTLPTMNGEKVVMRLLDRNASILRLDELGFSKKDLSRIDRLTYKPQGIILTTGPTGSGKTTTLYSMLQHGATKEKNYVTIEDPVEFYLDSAGQVMIKEKIGLNFPMVLRSILRQDPDVILLGEIRDLETAEVAFHAALTGHLVYSTLHTNSALATIVRLIDLGLPSYVVASALEGIIAQRLLRKICQHCKQKTEPNQEEVSLLGRDFILSTGSFWHSPGCSHCNSSGFSGRLAVQEVLITNMEFRNAISSGADLGQLTELAQRQGFVPLIENAKDKLRAGLTCASEIIRVFGAQTEID